MIKTTPKNFLSAALLLILSTISHAANFCEGLIHAQFALRVDEQISKIDVGTVAMLKHPTLDKELETWFLGRVQRTDGSGHVYLFYDPAAEELHVIPAERMHLMDNQGAHLAHERIKLHVRAEVQEGGTCAAYSLFHCIREIEMTAKPPAKVVAALATESDRIRLLMKAINQIYIDKTADAHLVNALQKIAGELDLKVSEHSTQTPSQFRTGILQDLQQGWPVVVRFGASDKMVDSDYSIALHTEEDYKAIRPHLWIPTEDVKKSKGGHAIVFLAAFEAKGEQFILVSDPNWQLPRVWPASYLDRVYTARMRAWTVSY